MKYTTDEKMKFPAKQARLAFSLGYQRPNITLPGNLDKLYSEAKQIRKTSRRSLTEITADLVLDLNRKNPAA